MIVNAKQYWAVSTGSLDPWRKETKTVIEYLRSLPGFVSIRLKGLWQLDWIFDSERNARSAKENMEDIGIACGKEISSFFAEEKWLKEQEL